MKQPTAWSPAALCVVALVATTAACSSPDAPTEASPRAAPAPSEIAQRVTWTPLAVATAQTLVVLPAEVVSAPHRTASLSPPLEGRLSAWLVAAGATVDVGTPLAALESLALDELAGTRAQLTTVLGARQRALALARRQLAAGFATSETVQEQLGAVAEARASLDEVRRREASLRALLGASGDDDGGSRWLWRSPTRGVVGEMRCSVGTLVRADTPCLTVSDARGAVVRVFVPQRFAAALGAERPGLVFHQEGAPEPLTLAWEREAPEIDARSRSRAMFFAPRDGAAALVPGASGRGDLVATVAEGIFAVPRRALTRIDGRDVVFIGPTDSPTPSPVRVVGRHGELALVQGEDVVEGRQVATTGVFLLKSVHLLEAP